MDDSGLILFTGEIGTGKTTIIRHMLRNLDDEFNVAVVFNTNVTSDQLLVSCSRRVRAQSGKRQQSHCHQGPDQLSD